MIERNIGDVFDFEGVTLKTVARGENSSCSGCFFIDKSLCGGTCLCSNRSDSTNVIFKEISKPSIELTSEPIAPPMFSKRESLALEYCKVCLPEAPESVPTSEFVHHAFDFADEFIKQSEKTK